MGTTPACLVVALAVLVVHHGVLCTNAQSLNIINGDPSGILEIGSTMPGDVTVVSRLGCSEFIRCLGNGSFVIWKRFTRRSELMSGGNRIISTEMMATDEEGVFSFISHLIFDPVTVRDGGSFTCNISDTVRTVHLSVEENFAVLNPPHYNLTDHFTGDEIAVLCPVQSCVPNITVQLLRGEVEIYRTVLAEPSVMVVQFNPTVNESLAGEYRCRVTGSFMGEQFSANEYFNITGTPQPRPTVITTKPPRVNQGSSATQLHGLTQVVFLLAALLSHIM